LPSDSLQSGDPELLPRASCVVRQHALAGCPVGQRQESHRIPTLASVKTLRVGDFVGEHCRHLSSPAFAIMQVESCVKKRAPGEERAEVRASAKKRVPCSEVPFTVVSSAAPLLSDACGERSRASCGVAATVDVPRFERRRTARLDVLLASAPLGDLARRRESVVRPDTWPVSRCGLARREAPWFR
jgi:hypothetical protein